MLRKTSAIHKFAAGHGASMRPQRNAAENGYLRIADRAVGDASMRPQRNAAENLQAICDTRPGIGASMRPQRNAAENSGIPGLLRNLSDSFNEAAA